VTTKEHTVPLSHFLPPLNFERALLQARIRIPPHPRNQPSNISTVQNNASSFKSTRSERRNTYVQSRCRLRYVRKSCRSTRSTHRGGESLIWHCQLSTHITWHRQFSTRHEKLSKNSYTTSCPFCNHCSICCRFFGSHLKRVPLLLSKLSGSVWFCPGALGSRCENNTHCCGALQAVASLAPLDPAWCLVGREPIARTTMPPSFTLDREGPNWPQPAMRRCKATTTPLNRNTYRRTRRRPSGAWPGWLEGGPSESA